MEMLGLILTIEHIYKDLNKIMKIQILLTILILLVLNSCRQPNKEERLKEKAAEYETITIDNCQYIKSQSYSDIIHKGSCSNPIHTSISRDYQIDIKDDKGVLYDGNRYVGNFNLLTSELDILIYRDNL